MGHREKCLVRTPLADRSSTSAALCCCHCYSKSLCLDHCGQRERQVRAAQPQTAPAPSNRPHPPASGGRARVEEEGVGFTAASKKVNQNNSDAGPHYRLFVHLMMKSHNYKIKGKRGQPGGERQSQKLLIKQSGERQTQQECSEKREKSEIHENVQQVHSVHPARHHWRHPNVRGKPSKMWFPSSARRARDTRANEAGKEERVNQ